MAHCVKQFIENRDSSKEKDQFIICCRSSSDSHTKLENVPTTVFLEKLNITDAWKILQAHNLDNIIHDIDITNQLPLFLRNPYHIQLLAEYRSDTGFRESGKINNGADIYEVVTNLHLNKERNRHEKPIMPVKIKKAILAFLAIQFQQLDSAKRMIAQDAEQLMYENLHDLARLHKVEIQGYVGKVITEICEEGIIHLNTIDGITYYEFVDEAQRQYLCAWHLRYNLLHDQALEVIGQNLNYNCDPTNWLHCTIFYFCLVDDKFPFIKLFFSKMQCYDTQFAMAMHTVVYCMVSACDESDPLRNLLSDAIEKVVNYTKTFDFRNDRVCDEFQVYLRLMLLIYTNKSIDLLLDNIYIADESFRIWYIGALLRLRRDKLIHRIRLKFRKNIPDIRNIPNLIYMLLKHDSDEAIYLLLQLEEHHTPDVREVAGAILNVLESTSLFSIGSYRHKRAIQEELESHRLNSEETEEYDRLKDDLLDGTYGNLDSHRWSQERREEYDQLLANFLSRSNYPHLSHPEKQEEIDFLLYEGLSDNTDDEDEFDLHQLNPENREAIDSFVKKDKQSNKEEHEDNYSPPKPDLLHDTFIDYFRRIQKTLDRFHLPHDDILLDEDT